MIFDYRELESVLYSVGTNSPVLRFACILQCYMHVHTRTHCIFSASERMMILFIPSRLGMFVTT